MARLFLTKEDRSILELWRYGNTRVLGDVNPNAYKEPNGRVIMVPCSDGHQIFDICEFQVGHTAAGHESMVHPLALNGGPLLLAPNSPLLAPGDTDDVVLFKHIGGAYPMKETPTVLLYAHAPCGAARDAKLDVVTVVDLLIQAKLRVKERFPHFQVVPKLHVDWAYQEREPNKKKSYFVSRAKFEDWRQVAA